ncbi:MAG: 2-oxoglutarate dehydrogenase complex dihydrolipoyllysine-residue succinyltransferase [gamma proteobacterium endosymbiont of Lamellibrachia anaximandri]|nr:2-oxoglutarate dehydrogenase complex dihydrolipoyllysine-residue succinyltransferase [gamma proteobacterium endosymbiont of Lamellibrachia anaximandri]MBL3618100.1 2-oxoglutarate dehydrogenase complex dihydrolipoyllysine-residue succinyltransferase [gamma proteobacterium endosymbiont of Lamellibrachia anaximandri]
MSIELRVPELPESVADATILTWHKKAGDRVSRDETLLDLETDKVVLEVPAPIDGILKEIRFNAGDTVQTDDVLGIVEAGATPSARKGETESKAEPMPVLTPAVRRLVKENGIDPGLIKGSGKNGRILKADVEAYIRERTPPPATENKKPPMQSSTPLLSIPGGERPEQRAPMTRLRKRVAERLLQAQQNAAILTTFNEVDLHDIKLLRSQYRETFESQHDVRLGYMSFFVKASVEALKRFPVVNASVDENDIIYHGYFDIGIAVSSPRGLVVPILRDADQLSFAEIEQQIRHFGEKAMEGTLSYEELTGGTFSITNGGVFGSMLSTPIINPPQSAILGMHAIQDRPVVENGEIVIRPMMYLALSYDHRIIDGKDAVQFLLNIKENLEEPARLMLQV